MGGGVRRDQAACRRPHRTGTKQTAQAGNTVRRKRVSGVKFVIKRSDKTEQYFFRIVSSNGQILASSEQYVAKQSAKDAIDSIKKGAAGADTDDQSE
jgi:uncharacterized protein YegP (UPF0339 family)